MRESSVLHLVQISDCHLYATREADLLGLNTFDSFQACVALLAKHQLEPDVVVATGDLSQDASLASYREFAKGMATVDCPVWWLPGNHDQSERMQQVFAEFEQFNPAKRGLLGNWQLILLDSTVPGKTHGELTKFQLEFLRQSVLAYPQYHALVLLHHPPFSVGSRWLDQIGVRNPQDFAAVLAECPQIRGVVCGHVHQEHQSIEQGVLYLSTPSTCIQFARLQPEFGVEPLPPGIRCLRLYPDGRIETQVFRAVDFEVSLDMNASGY